MDRLIICGVDDSESGRGAARVARGLSRSLGLGLVLVRVLEDGSRFRRINATADRLAELSDATSEVDRGADWVVERGHPADRLVALASRTNAALIVVGSRGPRSSSLGSISADVSKRAPCPVVVVPPGAGDRFQVEDASGGIARFGIGGGVTDSAGGVVRLGLGSSSA